MAPDDRTDSTRITHGSRVFTEAACHPCAGGITSLSVPKVEPAADHTASMRHSACPISPLAFCLATAIAGVVRVQAQVPATFVLESARDLPGREWSPAGTDSRVEVDASPGEGRFFRVREK